MKIGILGITGMLGSMVYNYLLQNSNFTFVVTGRRGGGCGPTVSFCSLDAEKSFECLKEQFIQCDFIINCIGVIKNYIDDTSSISTLRAMEVNGVFPHRLAQLLDGSKTKVIQIATDCVYDGLTGGYNEDAAHNATDVYGKTKSLGEVSQRNFINLRCSIIGPEVNNGYSLLEWFLSQSKCGKVKGFLNHRWNGVTTLQFAKICKGIVDSDLDLPSVQHVIPADILSKYEMLKVFAEVYERQDIGIEPYSADLKVDRSLTTLHQKNNRMLWEAAGYEEIPGIADMIRELRCTGQSSNRNSHCRSLITN